MICHSCNGLNNENAKFCRHCGSPLYDSGYTSTKLPLGTELDSRYKIIDYIAKGGMGAVYKAIDMQVHRVWAVKEMLDYFDSEGEREYAVERFATEAEILYKLDHPSIPRFVDCFVADNRYYLIMEYIEGVDLRKLLEDYQAENKQGLEEDDVVRWSIQVANVLHYLHTQDPPIIYRDLKPGNIMVTPEDKAYLIDFGIARLFDPRTKGTMVGTQGYAPPEQYRGEAEPRSDIYSLGACMHHLLTGKDPRNDIPFNFPSVRTIREDLSEKIEWILDKALYMDPNDRFATAEEFRKALESSEYIQDAADMIPSPEYAPVMETGVPAPVESDLEGDKDLGTRHIDIAVDETVPGRYPLWYMYRSDRRHSGKSPFGRNITGKKKWVFSAGSPIRSSPIVGGEGDVYFGANNGMLYALDSSGNQKWQFKSGARIVSSPTLDRQGNIYFGSNDSYLYCVNPEGELIWRFRTYGRVRSSPCISIDGVIYLGSYDHYLYALYPNGRLKWRINLGGYLESTPAVSEDGKLFISCRGLNNGNSYFYCLDPAGNIKWYQDLGGPSLSSACISRDGNIYVGASDNAVYSFDKKGVLQWKFYTKGPVMGSPVVFDGQGVLAGSFDCHIYLIGIDGGVQWKIRTLSPVVSSPALGGNNSVYVGSDDYYLYALSPEGTVNWKYKCGGRIRSSPAIAEGDLLYVGCDDGCIYALT